MRYLFGMFLSLSILLHCQVAMASDEWAGFWKLVQESGEKNKEFYLWVSSAGQLQLFDRSWSELHLAPSASRLEEEKVTLSQYLSGGQVLWSGQQEGDSVRGTWEFLHLQLQTSGTFSGTRICKAALASWGPRKAADASMSAEGVLNLTTILQGKAGDEGAFGEYWEHTFVPAFLPFLGDDIPSAPAARAALMSDQERSASRNLEEHVKNLRLLLKKNFPSFESPYHIVIAPVGEELRQEGISEGAYLVINSAKFTQDGEPELQISAKLLAAELYPYTRAYKKQEGSVYKTGLELFLLEQAYPKDLAEILGVTQKRLAALDEELPKLKEKMGKGKKLKDDERLYLSLAFARALVFSYSFRHVVKSPPTEIAKRLVEFIHVTGKDPEGGSAVDGARGSKRQPSRP